MFPNLTSPTTTHPPSLRDYMPSHAYTSSNTRSNNSTGPLRHQQEQTPPLQEVSRGRVWGEAVTTIRRPDGIFGYPLSMDTRVPKVSGVWCKWHEDPHMQEQREFCDTYEGYVTLCTCVHPVTASVRQSAPEITMNEIIPVAMLTAIKPFNFYRQLLNLLETPGAAQTPILVMVDGANTEILRLVRLFGLDVLVHRPQGAPGTTTLLNMHFRFSVHNVFNFFPEVDKAIILEDDLLLSPDFLSFFQQTAWLLDADPTIFCVNAFSVNSYREVAWDPTLLRRINMFPQFGWMISRRWAREQYRAWISEKQTGDWDWWLSSENSLQGRHALVPEVGRTYHAGAAGAHTGIFRMFIASETKSDEYNSFYVMQLCLRGFVQDSREKYNGAVRFNLQGRVLYIIGCPASPYCLLFPKGVSILKPSPELILIAERSSQKWQTRNYPPYYLQRSYVRDPHQEFLMENLLYRYWNGTFVDSTGATF
ncbi:O-linked-mannose beta-1-2-N-acetylglucosaminyltransferase 1-like 29 [Homarus americanus]|uniref:Alpha-1,3-mannosyl-glycoprotein 2-beta-N-acetylglucosaminyltransferase n=1 Tax=Homarus americanus TaxID=6706 RepID=A0A8J5JIN5_HOMAM|nr:O-linked-mannose beta-1-2-N-acetylglucosaminyltransferase 1-like 29 [Homarus americanus]